MRISKQVLQAFNNGKEATFNDDYNKSNGLPSLAEYAFLCNVRSDVFGSFHFGQSITQRHISKYLVDGLFTVRR